MKNRLPTVITPDLDFEPVPRKYRHDGWTADRQRAFIAALAETGSVKSAAERINMSPEGAYYLRRQPGADGFRKAWAAALDHGVQRLADIAIDRAIEGTPVPIFWRGEQVGEKRRYNERLMMFILRHHMPDRYGGLGLNPGTRAQDTIEREAAENCPVCRAEREANDPDADEIQARTDYLVTLLDRYAKKVEYERRARLGGDVVAADYTVRQLTMIEFMLTAVGGTDACRLIWQEAGKKMCIRAAPTDEDIHATELCRILDDERRAVWDLHGGLRPTTDPTDGSIPNVTPHGEDEGARIIAQHRARAQMAEAQALWEAAATEEGWAHYREQA